MTGIPAEKFIRTHDSGTLGLALSPLLEQAADEHSSRIALIDTEKELTYGELNAHANGLARLLVERGVTPGDRVCVALDRTVDLGTVLIAVLKAGAAYVPIDPAFPIKRTRQIMENAEPKLVIAEACLLDKALAPFTEICIPIDTARKTINEAFAQGNLRRQIRTDDLAYLIYTSGSTGTPKGVEVSHGSVANFVIGMQRRMGCSKTDRLLAVSTISFDMAVYELFTPLISGATVIIVPSSQLQDARALLGLMKSHAVTMLLATPTSWQMLLHAGWTGQPRLRASLSGGEALPSHVANKLLEYCDAVWNAYGPTEATGAACAWRVEKGEEMLIGDPLANVQVYVLENDLTPTQLGQPGELCIGGAGVTCGYRNNPAKTQAAFAPNPFGEGRLYRTGDLACFVTPEKLKLLGRADRQVKIRGYRIELGDIEAAITNDPGIAHAAVIERDGRLLGYYVPKEGANETTGEQAPEAQSAQSAAMRHALAKRLPSYMVPSFLVKVDQLPLTANGKLDDKALPNPLEGLMVTAKPTTALERDIQAVWSKVLSHGRIGTEDNFFEIGGDSERLIRVLVELEQVLHRRLSPAKLFQHYTIRSLVDYLQSSQSPLRDQSDSNSNDRKKSKEQHHYDEDIAVVSMACRLPGGVETADDFWELLQRGQDGISTVPKSRWDANAIYNSDPDVPGTSYCRSGGFVSSFDHFDASFFRIPPAEAHVMDPTQSLMLETCWEALERAGYTTEQLRGSQTSVFIGLNDSQVHNGGHNHIQGLHDLNGYTGTGTTAATASGRLAYILGLEGPTLTVDTACSSSLVATHLACTALRQGECNMAVSGAASYIPTAGLHVEFSRLRGVSPDGRCRAFSADADGTGLAEGTAFIVLKRLSDAQRDNDTILGVLRGSAVNHGGRSAGLTVPHGPAQERLIRTALGTAGLQPDDLDYVEAHGTGTKLGDPIEASALAEVFGPRIGSRRTEPLWLGSSKSNVGHTQAPAGLVGLIKVLLALQHHTLPPTLHAGKLTPAVDWEGAKLALVQKAQPWLPRDDRPRRAGVSAFGIGGTNAHVIVEEPPQSKYLADERSSIALSEALPFVLSGHTDEALRQQVDKLHQYLTEHETLKDRLGDVAYSLATSRDHFARRTVVMAQCSESLLDRLANWPGGAVTTPSGLSAKTELAMLFTGQGSQVPAMGKYLAQHFPIFHDILNHIAGHFSETLEHPLLDVMWAEDDSKTATLLQRTDYAQCSLFALEVALFWLWQSWGVKPSVVVGHSIGELAAAHVVGVMTLSDACRLVAARGRLMQNLPERGAMVSLQASATEVETAIDILGCHNTIEIAGQNTPMQTVASGDSDALQRLAAHFRGQGRQFKMLEVARAFHSHHMDVMLADLRAVAETVEFHSPTLDLVSTLTGQLAQPGELEDPSYWVRQARYAVHFSDAINTLVERGVNVFLELGPRPVLCGMGVASLADHNSSTAWLPSLRSHQQSDCVAIHATLADLHVRNFRVDWHSYFAPLQCRRVHLPTYAFLRHPLRPSTSGPSLQSKAFQIDWQPLNPVTTENVPPGGTWGLQCPAGDVAWAKEVATALKDTKVEISPVSSLQEAEGLDGVICLWDSDTDVLVQSREFTGQALGQLQTAAKMAFLPQLVWVTAQAVGTDISDRSSGLGAGPLWGLMRTVRSEHPDLRLRLIDLDGEATTKGVGMEALALLLALDHEPECTVRQGQLLVPRMQPAKPAKLSGPQSSFLRSDGAVLVTGGLSGLGSRLAYWLADTHGVRDLVLTSRRGMGAPGAASLVNRLEELGAKTTVLAGDISDAEYVRSVVATFNAKDRPLRGVFHTAGVADAGVLSSLTPDRITTTFAPKVDGAWHLHHCTRDMEDLDVFVVASSISGVMGMPGLGIYAAANAFLDALVHTRQAQGLPASAVAYGTLSGGGMNDGTGQATLAHLRQFGLDPLSPDESQGLLEFGVRSRRALTVAAALDLHQLHDYLRERGNIPPLLQLLLHQEANRKSMAGQSKPQEGPDLREVLRKAPREQHPDIMLRTVRDTVAKALGVAHAEEIDVHRPLAKVGIDSLTAILVRNQLGKLVGLTLSANIVFINPNIAALSQSLLSKMADLYDTTTQVSSTTSSLSSTSSSYTSTTPSSVNSSSPLNLEAIRKGCLDASISFDTSAGAESLPLGSSVLVTGATGFIGAFVVHALLSRGFETHCLVRAHCESHSHHRVVSTLEHYSLWDPSYTASLHAFPGDASQHLLGLSPEKFARLGTSITTIIHASGLVDWMLPLEKYLGPNIISTHECLRLAATPGPQPKSLHLISTVATLPRHGGYGVPDDDLEACYSASKLQAERMVAAARFRGANTSIYRLPFITAAMDSGHFRRDQGDFLHNLVCGSLELGAFPSIDAGMELILPVDYLAGTIVQMAVSPQKQEEKRRTRQQGRTGREPRGADFDFVNAGALRFEEYFALMARATGMSGGESSLPWQEWREQAMAYAETHPKSALARIAAVVDSCVNASSAAGLFEGIRAVGENVLGARNNHPAPVIDQTYVKRYIGRIQETGKKRSGERTGSSGSQCPKHET